MTLRKEKLIWTTRPQDPEFVSRLASSAGVPFVVAQTLVGRNIVDPEEVAKFLAPPNLAKGLYPPDRLPGCREAAKFLADAVRADKKIVVYGDYDVDGMTATAILLKALRTVGGRCGYYVPNRLEEGYGLNCEALERLREDEKADVVVTVDCGIASLKEADFAKQIGLDLVVTDHHTPVVDEKTGKQILPDARAVVHPKRVIEGEEPCPFPEICGAFVAFKLAWAIGTEIEGAKKTSAEMRAFLLQAIGLAALGAVADVVPLRDENRVLVRYALENGFARNMPVGLRRLVELSIGDPNKRITSEDLGFALAPRLNAAGREVLNENNLTDQEDRENWLYAKSLLNSPSGLAGAGQMGLAGLGVELLVTESQERANELAPFVNNLNATRQKLERKIVSEALKTIEEKYLDAPAFVLASRDWHPGVIGIAAGRVAERFRRPTIMIALREAAAGTGSARTAPDSEFNMYDALSRCSDYLVRFGGHSAAAGLGIKEANVDAFRDAFCALVAETISPSDRVPKLKLDGECPLSFVNFQTYVDLERLAPFGAENPRPIFAACEVQLCERAKRMGGKNFRTAPGKLPPPPPHFTARFKQRSTEYRAVAFKRGDWADIMNEILDRDPAARFDIAFQISFNDFSGRIELKLVDWRVSQ
ncbi:MAG: DHH family phosphoesterase [Thermoguttaceae bacterium]|nr:DHH family phosphoesterase [Thermoguttaceae bacterium]